MSKLFLVTLISLFIAFPAHGWNEPDSLMGLKFWRPVTEGALPECPLRTPFALNLPETPAVKKPSSGDEDHSGHGPGLHMPQKRQPTEAESALSRSRRDVLDSIAATRKGLLSDAEKNVAKHPEERQKAQEEYDRRGIFTIRA